MPIKLPDDFAKKRLYNHNLSDIRDDIILWEVLRVKPKQDIKIRFLEKNSKYDQGIRLAIDVGKGELVINGKSGRDFYLWENNAPAEINVKCVSEEGYLSIYPVYEWPPFGVQSQTGYSGMLLEQNGNIYTYYCNDAVKDSDFNALVFEIKLL